jgi:hypothetical protein
MHEGIKDAYKLLVAKPEGKRPLRRYRRRRGIILKWILKKYGARVCTAFNWLRIGSRSRMW